MLSPQDQQLFGLIRMAQVQRNTLIQLLSRQRSLEAIYGCYVRVLVQLPDSQADDYVIAKVLSAVEGESYTGYSQVSGESTNVYLVVQLPPSITADNGARFQLNTISNSPMREGEFQKWLNLMRDEMPTTIPTVEDLGPIITRLQSIQSHRGRGSHDTGRTELSVSNLAMHSSGNALAAMNDRPLHGGEASSAVLPSNRSTNIPRARRSPGASMSGGVPPFHPNQIPAKTNNYTQSSRSNPNLPSSSVLPAEGFSRHGTLPAGMMQNIRNGGDYGSTAQIDEEERGRLRQVVMNHLNMDCVLFPKEEIAKSYKLSQLRIIERDMAEYLQNVRTAIDDTQETCVVCLCSLPTVITMPCKHKLMCQECAYQVSECSVCREPIKEMFQPQEI